MRDNVELLINLQKDQTALIYSLWAVYQALTLAVIGYVFSQEFVRKNPVLLACLSLSLIAFSIGNHTAIMRAQNIVRIATTKLNDAALAPQNAGLKEVLESFSAPDTAWLKLSHILFSACAAIGVWVPYLAARVHLRFRDSA